MTMTPVRLLLLHHGPAHLLLWSGDGGDGPGEMGEAAWGRWGGEGPLSLPPLVGQPPVPLAMRRHDEHRAWWGRRENIPIYGSPGRVRTMHMRIRRLLEAATVVFWRDFSHAGDDGSAGDSLNGAIVFLFLKRFSLERSSP
jgi:hypothetical protein